MVGYLPTDEPNQEIGPEMTLTTTTEMTADELKTVVWETGLVHEIAGIDEDGLLPDDIAQIAAETWNEAADRFDNNAGLATHLIAALNLRGEGRAAYHTLTAAAADWDECEDATDLLIIACALDAAR